MPDNGMSHYGIVATCHDFNGGISFFRRRLDGNKYHEAGLYWSGRFDG